MSSQRQVEYHPEDQMDYSISRNFKPVSSLDWTWSGSNQISDEMIEEIQVKQDSLEEIYAPHL